MIISDDGFFRELADNRVCVITGRLGSGKTLLSLEIARYFLDRGYHLVTNTKTIWADDPREVMRRAEKRAEETGIFQTRTVLFADEGGLYARSPKIASDLASFARKTDQIIIFGGKKLPHPYLSDLQVVMWFDFHKNFLLPIKIWEWSYRLSSRKIYYGKIIQAHWTDYYGIYSTIDPADNADQIINFSVTATRKLFAAFGRDYTLSGMGGRTQPSTADAMEDLATALGDVVEQNLSSVQGGKRRGRK